MGKFPTADNFRHLLACSLLIFGLGLLPKSVQAAPLPIWRNQLPVLAENTKGFSRHLFRNYKNYLNILKANSDIRINGGNLILELEGSFNCDFRRVVISVKQEIEPNAITEKLIFNICGETTGVLSLRREGSKLTPTKVADLLNGHFPLPEQESLWHLKNSWNESEIIFLKSSEISKTYYRNGTQEIIIVERSTMASYDLAYQLKYDLKTESGFTFTIGLTQAPESMFISAEYSLMQSPIDATSFNEIYPSIQWQIDSLASSLFTIPGISNYLMRVY